VLLHAAGKGNNDVPAFPDFERFKVKGNLVSGLGHLRKQNSPERSWYDDLGGGHSSAQRIKSQGIKIDYAEIQRTKTQSQKSASGTAKNSRAKGDSWCGGATEERSGFE
jgi:hypothetical protein